MPHLTGPSRRGVAPDAGRFPVHTLNGPLSRRRSKSTTSVTMSPGTHSSAFAMIVSAPASLTARFLVRNAYAYLYWLLVLLHVAIPFVQSEEERRFSWRCHH